MRRLWVLAWKEVKLSFRDVGGIITMLVSPLVLTVVIGAAFSGGGSMPLSDIPVLLLDLDQSPLSESLVDVFDVEGVQELVDLEVVSDEAATRARVEADEVAALVVIPHGLGDRVVPIAPLVRDSLGLDLLSLDPEASLSAEQQAGIAQAYLATQSLGIPPATVEIYASPDWRLSASVIKSVVQQGLEIMNMQIQGISVVVSKLAASASWGETAPTEGSAFVPSQVWVGPADLGDPAATSTELPIEVETVSKTGRSFDWASYTAPSMAMLFLMFAVTSGGKMLLAERRAGTLPRLLTSPMPALTVLLGKMAGVALTGLLQMVILWAATSLIGAYWGPAPAALLSIVLLVACASGVGAMISAWAKAPGQASAIGASVTLVGSAVSGTYFPRAGLPQWLQAASLVTPNAWGIEVFSQLQLGKGLVDILPLLGGVVLVTVVYYAIALAGFRRQFS